MNGQLKNAASGSIAAWLLLCCVLVLIMVVVGGVTRLTHSGLSIVEWRPVVGTIPPLNQSDWDNEFKKYQATPEYQQVNKGMSVDEFKRIYWWEYSHRLLGRSIGLVFLLPFLYFLLRGNIRGPLAWKLAGIFVLGALQGGMGWYMVKSGLVDDPRVSQYRLAAHLGIAFLILGAMLWTALDLLDPPRGRLSLAQHRLARHALAISALIFLMVISGAFVAGIRAGLAYNSFPLMNGHFIPPGILMLDPWWKNLFANIATVQFNHRLIAWLLIVLIPLFWLTTLRLRLPRHTRVAVGFMLTMLVIQVGLGIATLLLAVPVSLAAAHQGGAAILFCASLWTSHSLRGN